MKLTFNSAVGISNAPAPASTAVPSYISCAQCGLAIKGKIQTT